MRAYEILTWTLYTWNIDPALVDGIGRWIRSQQHADGHFETDPNNTLDERLLMTAKTVAVFLETGGGLDEVRIVCSWG